MKAWKTTNASISQSAVRTARFAHRVVMNDAFSEAGSQRTWVIRKWLRASTKSPSPVRRIRYQTASSKPPPGFARPPDRDAIGRLKLISAAPDRLEDDVADGQPDDRERDPRDVPHLPMPAGHRRPEIHDHDAESVQGVVQQRGTEEELADPSGRAGVDGQQLVVELAVRAGQPDVEDVQDDEHPDREPGDPVEGPGDHSL